MEQIYLNVYLTYARKLSLLVPGVKRVCVIPKSVQYYPISSTELGQIGDTLVK